MYLQRLLLVVVLATALSLFVEADHPTSNDKPPHTAGRTVLFCSSDCLGTATTPSTVTSTHPKYDLFREFEAKRIVNLQKVLPPLFASYGLAINTGVENSDTLVISKVAAATTAQAAKILIDSQFSAATASSSMKDVGVVVMFSSAPHVEVGRSWAMYRNAYFVLILDGEVPPVVPQRAVYLKEIRIPIRGDELGSFAGTMGAKLVSILGATGPKRRGVKVGMLVGSESNDFSGSVMAGALASIAHNCPVCSVVTRRSGNVEMLLHLLTDGEATAIILNKTTGEGKGGTAANRLPFEGVQVLISVGVLAGEAINQWSQTVTSGSSSSSFPLLIHVGPDLVLNATTTSPPSSYALPSVLNVHYDLATGKEIEAVLSDYCFLRFVDPSQRDRMLRATPSSALTVIGLRKNNLCLAQSPSYTTKPISFAQAAVRYCATTISVTDSTLESGYQTNIFTDGPLLSLLQGAALLYPLLAAKNPCIETTATTTSVITSPSIALSKAYHNQLTGATTEAKVFDYLENQYRTDCLAPSSSAVSSSAASVGRFTTTLKSRMYLKDSNTTVDGSQSVMLPVGFQQHGDKSSSTGGSSSGARLGFWSELGTWQAVTIGRMIHIFTNSPLDTNETSSSTPGRIANDQSINRGFGFAAATSGASNTTNPRSQTAILPSSVVLRHVQYDTVSETVEVFPKSPSNAPYDSSVSALAFPCVGDAAVVALNGKVYVHGGTKCGSAQFPIATSGTAGSDELFKGSSSFSSTSSSTTSTADLSPFSWELVATQISPTTDVSSSSTGTTGSRRVGSGRPIFNPEKTGPSGRRLHQAFAMNHTHFVIWGGVCQEYSGSEYEQSLFCNDVWIYDTVAQQWSGMEPKVLEEGVRVDATILATPPTGRCFHGGTVWHAQQQAQGWDGQEAPQTTLDSLNLQGIRDSLWLIIAGGENSAELSSDVIAFGLTNRQWVRLCSMEENTGAVAEAKTNSHGGSSASDVSTVGAEEHTEHWKYVAEQLYQSQPLFHHSVVGSRFPCVFATSERIVVLDGSFGNDYLRHERQNRGGSAQIFSPAIKRWTTDGGRLKFLDVNAKKALLSPSTTSSALADSIVLPQKCLQMNRYTSQSNGDAEGLGLSSAVSARPFSASVIVLRGGQRIDRAGGALTRVDYASPNCNPFEEENFILDPSGMMCIRCSVGTFASTAHGMCVECRDGIVKPTTSWQKKFCQANDGGSVLVGFSITIFLQLAIVPIVAVLFRALRMLREVEQQQAAIADLTDAVAELQFDRVAYLEQLEEPTRMQIALLGCVRNLKKFRSFVPPAILSICDRLVSDLAPSRSGSHRHPPSAARQELYRKGSTLTSGRGGIRERDEFYDEEDFDDDGEGDEYDDGSDSIVDEYAFPEEGLKSVRSLGHMSNHTSTVFGPRSGPERRGWWDLLLDTHTRELSRGGNLYFRKHAVRGERLSARILRALEPHVDSHNTTVIVTNIVGFHQWCDVQRGARTTGAASSNPTTGDSDRSSSTSHTVPAAAGSTSNFSSPRGGRGGSSDVLAKRISKYSDIILQTIQQFGGIADVVIGDKVIATWNGMQRHDDPCHGACMAAYNISSNRMLHSMNLKLAVGVSTGSCFVGIVGNDRVKHPLLLSPVVGEAMSLCRATQNLSCDILIPFSMANALDSRFVLRIVGVGHFYEPTLKTRDGTQIVSPKTRSYRHSIGAGDSAPLPPPGVTFASTTGSGSSTPSASVTTAARGGTGNATDSSTTLPPAPGTEAGAVPPPHANTERKGPPIRKELIAELLAPANDPQWLYEERGMKEGLEIYNTVQRLLFLGRLNDARRVPLTMLPRWYITELEEVRSKGELHTVDINTRW